MRNYKLFILVGNTWKMWWSLNDYWGTKSAKFKITYLQMRSYYYSCKLSGFRRNLNMRRIRIFDRKSVYSDENPKIRIKIRSSGILQEIDLNIRRIWIFECKSVSVENLNISIKIRSAGIFQEINHDHIIENCVLIIIPRNSTLRRSESYGSLWMWIGNSIVKNRYPSVK